MKALQLVCAMAGAVVILVAAGLAIAFPAWGWAVLLAAFIGFAAFTRFAERRVEKWHTYERETAPRRRAEERARLARYATEATSPLGIIRQRQPEEATE